MPQTCISEAQKYQGALYQDKKTKAKNNRQPRVEDIDTPPSPQKKVTFEPPPPAPSPPAAAAPALNVFDFLVPEDSDSDSGSEVSSDSDSGKEEDNNNKSPSSEIGRGRPKPSGNAEDATSGQQHSAYLYHHAYNQHQYPPGYTYPPQQQTHYPATAYWYPQPPSQAPLQQSLLTPGHPPPSLPTEESRTESQKKRKRSSIDLVQTTSMSNGSLQTGLTGGLNKLLSAPEEDAARAAEASPLSPKKRHKRSIDETSKSLKARHDDKAREKEKRRTASNSTGASTALTTTGNKERGLTSKRSARPHHDDDLRYDSDLERRARGTMTRKALTYPRQASHSEFFLTLIDKDHHSVKGQSI